MNKLFIYILISLLLLFSACSRMDGGPEKVALDPSLLDAARAFEEVELLLRIPNRDAGTPGAKQAAGHIQERLKEIGLEARIEAFRDPTPRGTTTFRNVVAEIPGKGAGVIILGSHYDTKSGMEEGFQGANDSGSSTGLLIELARIFSQSPRLKNTLQLVFFDGEECFESYNHNDGLHGSRHHAQGLMDKGRAEKVEAVIIMDMVGDRDLNISFPRNSEAELIDLAFQAARAENVRTHFGLSEHAVLDDHVPFLSADMPAINFIDFQFGSAPGLNDYWHTPEDRIENISAESLKTTGRVVLKLVELIDNKTD